MKVGASFLKRGCQARGSLVAKLLTGAWRGTPPQHITSSQELAEVATLLLRSGAAGLAWHKTRHSGLGTSSAADQFHQAYRLNCLQAALHERSLKQVIPLLRNVGVEPVLVKGWSVARLYPEPGLRPYCDLDLCVLPDHYPAAEAFLRSPEGEGCGVDLHVGFGKFYDNEADDVFARSQLVKLDDLEIRVLSAEDQLRFLCMHLLRHGAVRPLWLCDIGVLIETRPPDFNWDRCIGNSSREADWVACAMGLAHRLLGVDVKGIPVLDRIGNLPSWLVPAVLKEWGKPFRSRIQLASYLRNPSGPLRELLRHWPNPIEATMTVQGPFNELPRLFFQLGHIVSRSTSLMAQLSSARIGDGLRH